MKNTYKLILLLLVLLSACTYDTIEPNIVIPDDDQITFTKADGADPALAENQDRITDNVWITRGNGGGQIFNIKLSQVSNKDNSPLDTEWAIGDKADRNTLTFSPFRQVGQPKSLLNTNLVMHLITDDIYLNVRFTSWSSGQLGGFSYIRDKVPE